MSFYEQLAAETADARNTLLSSPIVEDCLRGEVSLPSYLAFLGQAFHHVRHTTPLLMSLGGNQWAETATSGPPLVGIPTSAKLGVLQSAAVEESNTDLTAELVKMIVQQRNYQANAQTIKTQDQIMQTLVNLR